MVGTEGVDPLAGVLASLPEQPRVRRFSSFSEAGRAMRETACDVLVLDADALRAEEIGEARSCLRDRPGTTVLLLHSPRSEDALAALEGFGVLGLRKPLRLGDLAAAGRLAFHAAASPRAPRDRLAVSLARELRGLGRALLGCVEGREEGMAPGSTLRGVRAAAREVLELADRLDAIAGLIPADRERFDLRDLLDVLVASFRESGGGASPFELRGDRGAVLAAPRIAFERAVRDLLAFVLGAARPGGRVLLQVTPGPPVRLAVVFPPASLGEDDLGRIFEPLGAGDGRFDEGVGVRLDAVRGLVGALGGRLSVEAPETGTVRLTLEVP